MQKKLTNLSFGKFILPVFLFLISFSLINFAEAADDNKAIVSDVSNPLVIRAQSGLTTFYSRLQFLPTVNSFKLNALSIDNNAAKSVTIFDYLASPTLFQMLDGNLNYNPTTKFIGIGATSPAAKLDVGGTFKVTGALNSVVLDKLAGTGNRIVMTDSGGSLYAGVVTDTTNYWSPNGTHIFNNNTGNVGIGISAPGAKLDVAGAIRTNNQLISTVANGTAPLVVTSKTLVSNLNVDQVDGFSASDLQFFQSDRDFATGTLIKTDINYSASSGEPFLLEIEGNSYGSQYPFNTKIQGYIYSDTIISKGGVSIGTPISQLVAFNYDGKLCFWFPRQSYWQGFSVFVNSSYSGVKKNRLVSITSEAKPTEITKEVSFNIIESAIIGGTTNYLSKFSGNKSIINSLIFDNGTYVGISKTNPGYKLDVAGDANFAGQIHGVSVPTQGTDAANKNYVDSSFASSSAENLWAGSLTGNIWNKNTGKVGIGITNPGIYQLFVNGPTYINGASTIFGVATINTGIELANGGGRYVKYYGSDDGYKTQMQTTATSGYGVYGPVSGDWALYNRFSGATDRGWIWQNGTTNVAGVSLGGDMQIAGNFKSLGAGKNYFGGNVGIGVVDPEYKLEIYGLNPTLKITQSTGTTGNSTLFLSSTGAANFVDLNLNGGHIFKRSDNGDKYIYFGPDTTLASAKLAINFNDGNVGIGTITPSVRLDLGGGTAGRISGLDTAPAAVRGDSEAVPKKWIVDNFAPIIGSALWATNGNHIYNSNAGNVGVGVTAPTKKLDVAGDFQLLETIGTSLSGVIYKNGNRFIYDFSYGKNAGNITPSGNNLFVGTNAGNFTMGSNATVSTQSSFNTGVGNGSLQSNQKGERNSALGFEALKLNVNGYSNSAFGFKALTATNDGTDNSAFGSESLKSNTYGAYNSAFGSASLAGNTTGQNNTAVGYYALGGVTTGNHNSALGLYAGTYLANDNPNTNSQSSIFIGNYTRSSSSGAQNEIVIGNSAIGAGNNSIVLGNLNTFTTVLKGNVGIGTTSPLAALDVDGLIKMRSSNITTSSDVINKGYLDSAISTVLASTSAVNYWTANGNNIFNNNAGNVGIGTNNPQNRLVISGPDSGTPQLRLMGTLDTARWWDVGRESASTGRFVINEMNTGVNTERFTILMGGNIGIGTTAPGAKLDVAGNVSFGDVINLGNLSTVATSAYRGISWHNSMSETNYAIFKSAGAWTQPLNIAFVTGIKIGANSAYGGTKFFNSSAMSTELMSVGSADNHVRIANNLYVTGNVGIGTTAPSVRLDLGGGTAGRITGLDTAPAAVRGDSEAVPKKWIVDNFAPAVGGASLWSTSTFGIHNSLPYTKVGIGKTNPTNDLDVNGIINATTGYRVNNVATAGSYLRGNGANFVASTIAAGDVPTLNQNTTGSAFYLSSRDTRNVDDLPRDFSSANGIKFDFKSSETNGFIGGGTYNGVMTWRKYGSGEDFSGGKALQIAYSDSGNLWTRPSFAADKWDAWKQILNSDSGVVLQSTTPGAAQTGNINLNGTITAVNINASGAIAASSFSGPISGTVSAANVSSGEFGSLTGGGNYIFGTNVTSKVGIGTTAPAEKLHVVGNNYTTGYQQTGGATYTGAGLWFGSNTSVGIYKSTNDIRFKSTVDLMTIAATGKVGIGTTIPTEKLEVNGNILISKDNSLNITDKDNNNVYVLTRVGTSTILNGNWSNDGGKLQLRTGNGWGYIQMGSGAINTSTDFNPQVTMSGATGNFGIGQSGLEPQARLHVYSASTAAPAAIIDSPSSNTANSLEFRVAGTKRGHINFSRGILIGSQGPSGGPDNSVSTGQFNIGIGSLAINSGAGAGNVAIGNSAVQAAVTSRNIGIGDNALNSTGSGGGYNIAIGDSAMYNGGGQNNIAIGSNALNVNGVGNFNIAIGNPGKASSSSLYIGDIERTSLHTPLIYGEMTSDQYGIGYGVAIGTTTLVGYGGPLRAALTVNGAVWAKGAVFAAAFSQTSDSRVKHNIKNLGNDDYQKVLKLKPVSFTFNETNLDSYGFIAQDVIKLFPNAVTSNVNGIMNLSYTDLIAPTVVAVQAQEKRIEEQETLIHILIDRINKLENKIK